MPHIYEPAWTEMRANPSIAHHPKVRGHLADVERRLGYTPASLEDLTHAEQDRLAFMVDIAQRDSRRTATDRLHEAKAQQAALTTFRAGRAPKGVPVLYNPHDGTSRLLGATRPQKRSLSPQRLAEQRQALDDATDHLQRVLRQGKAISAANKARLETALSHVKRAKKAHAKMAEHHGMAADALEEMLKNARQATRARRRIGAQRAAVERSRTR